MIAKTGKYGKYKNIIIEVILTILLVLLFQYIMGQRELYYDSSSEPIANGAEETVDETTYFVQQVICEKDYLQGVMVSAYADDREKAELSLKVFDEEGNRMQEIVQPLSKDDEYSVFLFENAFSGCQGKKLYLVFQSDTEQKICLRSTGQTEILVNAEHNICVRLVYKTLNMGRYKKTVYLSGITIWFVLSVCLIWMTARHVKTEYIFWAMYLSLGILYMAFNPLYTVLDESAHFARVYAIAQGDLIPEYSDDGIKSGNILPENILYGNKYGSVRLPDLIAGKDVEVSSRKEFLDYSNSASALYSPFTYVAQVLGVAVGRQISNKIFFIAYCGRFTAWLLIGCILFYSIKYIPFGKNILLAVSLLPMNMHESISLAGDSFTFAVVMAFLAFVLYERYTKKETEPMGWKEYGVLYILMFFIASCKIVYVPLCMLAFLIPQQRFGKRRNYVKNVLLAISEVALTSGIWLFMSMDVLGNATGGKSQEQIQYILQYPLTYIETVVNTTMTYGEVFVKYMLGTQLGWVVGVNTIIIAAAGVTLAYISIHDRGFCLREKNMIWPRACMMFSVVCVIALIYTSLYVQWTEVGNKTIEGIHGRYFLPILLPAIFSLQSKKQSLCADLEKEKISCVPYLFILITNLCVLVTLLTAYVI